MKQLVIIVQTDDAEPACVALRDAAFRFTRLASTGGYLGTPNLTLIMAVEDERVDEVLSLLRETCRTRDIEVPLVLPGRLRDWQDAVVNYAGAMVIITDAVEVIRI